MCNDSNYKKECKRCNVEKWEKALRIAEIRKETNCTYEQAEQVYNDEKAKKRYERKLKISHIFFVISSKQFQRYLYRL